MARRRQEGLREVRARRGGLRAGSRPGRRRTTAATDDDGLRWSACRRPCVELQRLTERLRRECPWDREQTARTIVPHTVEEAYEVADAALAGDDAKLLDELGDLLFQVDFLALLLEERGEGDLATARAAIHEKLVAGTRTSSATSKRDTAGACKENWERIKREQEGRDGVFHDVPEALPALLLRAQGAAAGEAVGFEYPDIDGALADLDDELRELKDDLECRPSGAPRSSATCCSRR